MKAKIIKIDKRPSKYSKTLPFYYFFFRNESGKSYRSCISPIYRNYIKWNDLVEKAKDGEIWVDGLITKTINNEEIIDADSPVVICNSPIIRDHKPKQSQTMKLFTPEWDRGQAVIRQFVGAKK